MWAPGQIPMTTQTSAPPVPMTLREVLRLTVMRRVFYAQMVSLLGDFLAIFAVISVVTYRMHGTPAQVTGVQFSYMLPLAVLGPLSGVFVDRWPIKPTLVASDLAAGDFVRWMKQLIDLAGQVADAAGPGDLRDTAREVVRRLTRGVVAYSSLTE